MKSNIGHLEAAAGLAGVVKVLMALQRGELPPTLHCEEVNRYIELEGTPFYLVRARQPWPRRVDSSGRELPRRAGVSSFGFGGTNAHAVFEEYVQKTAPHGAGSLPPRAFADNRYWIPGARAAGPTRVQAEVLLIPEWVEARARAGFRHVLRCPSDPAVRDGRTRLRCAGFPCVAGPAAAGDIGRRYRTLATFLLETLQQQLREPARGQVLIQARRPARG